MGVAPLPASCHLITFERDGYAKAGYLGDINDCLGDLPHLEASRHSTNEGLLFDGLKGTDPLFTCEKDGHAKSGLRDIFGASTGPRLG